MKERADSGIPSAAQLSDRLSVLVSDVGSRFNGFGPGMDENWQDVVDRKVATYDWHISLPQAAATAWMACTSRSPPLASLRSGSSA